MLALAGTASATLVQLTLVGFGMAAVMGALAGWFGLHPLGGGGVSDRARHPPVARADPGPGRRRTRVRAACGRSGCAGWWWRRPTRRRCCSTAPSSRNSSAPTVRRGRSSRCSARPTSWCRAGHRQPVGAARRARAGVAHAPRAAAQPALGRGADRRRDRPRPGAPALTGSGFDAPAWRPVQARLQTPCLWRMPGARAPRRMPCGGVAERLKAAVC